MSTTKRAWKLQEFVAHGANVNCLALGHKSGRVMVTGGEDKKVNMWAVGKPNCIMSLSGHTSPIESVRFGNAEELVVAGSMSGALKIWDLEAAKIVRTLTGHKSSIRSLDFHPYGDFVASGSLDTNIKLWDIRRKGCIFTYKGHTNCVNCLRFSPDGRWIASGGEDGLLKIWDLTAGKLLTDLKSHTGAINTMEFHPNEFLLASGGSDRVVKYWDLESFQLVSSTDGDSSPVRCIFFHPEGLCLYSGGSDLLKVYGWEPARCFDTLSMGWGRVADIGIAQNQLIGATFSQTNVSTYVVDIQRVAPIVPAPVQSGGHSAPLSPPPQSSSGRKSFCVERPATQSTKRANPPKEAPEEAVTPSDDQDDDFSRADIIHPDDYRQIFQPTKQLPRDDFNNYVIHRQPPPPAFDNVTPASKPQPQIEVVPPTPYQSAAASAAPPQPKVEPFPAPPDDGPPNKPAVVPEREVKKQPPPQKIVPPPAPVTPKPAEPAINVNDFLPKQVPPTINNQKVPADMSEADGILSINRGHDSMTAVMTSRYKNLQIIRALWTSGNIKTAVDSGLGMNDQAIMVDILNIIVGKPSLWNLDLCGSLLPTVRDLISSKYDNYVETGCNALKIILRNFATVIKSNIAAPPSIGVDISREERYRKCKACYGVLMEIRSQIERKSAGRPSDVKFRELQLLLSQLD